MFRTYIKTAWRNISKRGFYSGVNILGLSGGILFALLIGVYVWSELHVNRKLHHAANQYFLESQWKDPNMGVNITTLGPLSKRLKEDYPALVKNYYRWDGITSVVSKGDKHMRENIQLGDSTLLSMFGFTLLNGNAATALENPYSVVITAATAIKYFGKTAVVGQTLSIQSFSGTQHEFAITGVLNDIPENSVTQLNDANHNNLFIPTNTFAYFGRSDFESWTNIYLPSYIELGEGVTAKDLETPIRRLIKQNTSDGIQQNLTVHPVALTDYYLQKNNGLVSRMLYTLSFIGLFILLMAVINFINISISSSSARTKEIGVRKLLGSRRKQIILQFLTESVILVFMATVLAIAAYPFARPLFNDMVGKEVPSLFSFPVYFVWLPAAIVLVVGILAGLYPALVLSSLKPADSLKGKLTSVKEKIWLRKSLVGFQFGIAGIVLIAAYIVSQQVAYFFGQSLGFNKEYIVSSQVPRNWSPEGVRKMETVRNEFAQMPQISAATLSYEIPDGMYGGDSPVYRAGEDSVKAVAMQSLVTDPYYLTAYQIPLKAGSFFSSSEMDSSKVVLNEKAVYTLGWNNAWEAIGKQVKITGSPLTYTIQGVTADFHFASMQQRISPDIFFSVRLANVYRYFSFKIKPGNVGNTIEAIQKKWAALLPGSSFEYRFMDETLRNVYRNEIQLKKAAYMATVLSLMIVLLGILGLVSLNIQKRTKEIGIRKVLGSSVTGIITLFMKEFLWVILIACGVACPLAYLLMQHWLNDYAYRIDITWQPFLVSVILLAFITALLICLQTFKAALANPSKSLRTE